MINVPWEKGPFPLASLIHLEVNDCDCGFVSTRAAHWGEVREKEELGLEVRGCLSTWPGRGTS